MTEMTERRIVPKAMKRKEEGGGGRPEEYRFGDLELPGWVKRVHQEQVDAVEQVLKEYALGARVVFLDAPTGSGKSLIGELARRRLGVDGGLYVCSTKSLQAQYERDFPYARVLKGRANYTPTKLSSREKDGYRQGNRGGRGLGITCSDCDVSGQGEDKSCSYCWEVEECPYRVAKAAAAWAPVGVLNTAYFLASVNYSPDPKGNPFVDREFVVADESDLLEGELLGFVELRVGARRVEELGLEVPKKGSHMKTIRAWLEEELKPKLEEELKALRGGDLETRREKARMLELMDGIERVLDREEGWVRDGEEEGERTGDGLVLKPVSIEDVGEKYLWGKANKWLCMTGTLVSAEMEAESLGLEEAGIRWAEVKVPMSFAAENRRVVFAPWGDMTRKGQEAGGVEKVKTGVKEILLRHPGVNVLIHTHTYNLAKEMSEWVEKVDGRKVFTYTNAWDREKALKGFREESGRGGGVLVASSMDRGIDLPGDLCRVQVIVKVPFASLGSRQVSERLRTRGGQLWYLVGTVRTIMQMCGRAVRGRDDWAVTYVVDEQFGKVYKDGMKMKLWPKWWMEGLETEKVGRGRVRENG